MILMKINPPQPGDVQLTQKWGKEYKDYLPELIAMFNQVEGDIDGLKLRALLKLALEEIAVSRGLEIEYNLVKGETDEKHT